jgi:GNAT superfamily N-acetyltransferase
VKSAVTPSCREAERQSGGNVQSSAQLAVVQERERGETEEIPALDSLLTIRSAGAEDLKEVLSVLVLAYQPFEAWVPWSAITIHLAELFELRRSVQGSHFLVAEVNGRIEGVAMCHPMASRVSRPRHWLSVRALGVAPGAQRLGLARALLAACVSDGMASGAAALCLHLADFMSPARELVEALGLIRVAGFDFRIGAAYGLTPDQAVAMRAYVLPFE